MTKRKIWLAVGAMSIISAVVMTACGSESVGSEKENDLYTLADHDRVSVSEVENSPADDGKEPAEDQQGSAENIMIRISWWGDEAIHEATREAIDNFMKRYPNINVEMQYGREMDWEKSLAAQFSSGTMPDISQISWEWIDSCSSDGSIFADLNQYSEIIDLSQYSHSVLELCTAAGKLQAIPAAVTGQLFCWNKTVFEQAGIGVPTNPEELYDAAEVFRTVLGDDYYPLVLDEKNRMALMIYYLESVFGKAWMADQKLQYLPEEIEKGMEFIQSLEEHHVIPSVRAMAGDNMESSDQGSGWGKGIYAGVFVRDSAVPAYQNELPEGQELVLGDGRMDFGAYQGGSFKPTYCFAISENSQYKSECALLLNYLLNEEEGTAVMAAARGIPLSQKAFDNCFSRGLLDQTGTEVYKKILSRLEAGSGKWLALPEAGCSSDLYKEIFTGLSYKSISAAVLSEQLAAAIQGE